MSSELTPKQKYKSNLNQNLFSDALWCLGCFTLLWGQRKLLKRCCLGTLQIPATFHTNHWFSNAAVCVCVWDVFSPAGQGEVCGRWKALVAVWLFQEVVPPHRACFLLLKLLCSSQPSHSLRFLHRSKACSALLPPPHTPPLHHTCTHTCTLPSPYLHTLAGALSRCGANWNWF